MKIKLSREKYGNYLITLVNCCIGFSNFEQAFNALNWLIKYDEKEKRAQEKEKTEQNDRRALRGIGNILYKFNLSPHEKVLEIYDTLENYCNYH